MFSNDAALASGNVRIFNLRDVTNPAGTFTGGNFTTPINCAQRGTSASPDLTAGCSSTQTSAATAGHFIDIQAANQTGTYTTGTTTKFGFGLVLN